MNTIYDQLRAELSQEFEARFNILERQHDLLQDNYVEIIKEVHHQLGGIIVRIEGLINLEEMEGTQFKHLELLKAEFIRAGIRRRTIQAKYIDTFKYRKSSKTNKKDKS